MSILAAVRARVQGQEEVLDFLEETVLLVEVHPAKLEHDIVGTGLHSTTTKSVRMCSLRLPERPTLCSADFPLALN